MVYGCGYFIPFSGISFTKKKRQIPSYKRI